MFIDFWITIDLIDGCVHSHILQNKWVISLHFYTFIFAWISSCLNVYGARSWKGSWPSIKGLNSLVFGPIYYWYCRCKPGKKTKKHCREQYKKVGKILLSPIRPLVLEILWIFVTNKILDIREIHALGQITTTNNIILSPDWIDSWLLVSLSGKKDAMNLILSYYN